MAAAVAAMAGTLASPASAGSIELTVTFDDPLRLGLSYYASIESHLEAALGNWARHLDGQASLEVLVMITPDVRGIGAASATSGFVGFDGDRPVFEQGMAFELRTGVDPNAAEPDVIMSINPGYLHHELWFDPDPGARTAPVDPERTDAVSAFLHEIGHALAFNGWRDGRSFVDGVVSTWDRQVTYGGGTAHFHGPAATALYGGAVPVTWGYDYHVGNSAGPGVELLGDVMNGVTLSEGLRYDVSPLDLAMLRDMGVATSPAPEPSTVVMMFVGVVAVAVSRRARRRAA